MKNLFTATAILFALAGSFYSQAPAPTQTPQEEEVVKIGTNLIQVDATVTDRRGNPIRDLRPEEFEVYENGKKQKITTFRFVSGSTTAERRAASDPLPNIPQPPPRVSPENVHRTIVLMVDDLTLSFSSMYHVKRALRRFVESDMQPGDLVAIIRTGGGVGALQQFTTDKNILYATIDRLRWNPGGTGSMTSFQLLPAHPDLGLPEGRPKERSLRDFERDAAANRASIYAAGSVGAIKYVIQGMAELPGRKSMIIFSDGFQITHTDARGIGSTNRVLEGVRSVIDLANRASVVIYTIDPRGLMVGSSQPTDHSVETSVDGAVEESNDRRQAKMAQDGLRFLAKETGGFSVVNQNDINLGIRRAMDDQSYYLLGYEPEDQTFDPKLRRFNRLEVKVTRRDAQVRYRSGFFGITDDQMLDTRKLESGNIIQALISPFAVSNVTLRLNAMFGSSQKDGSFVRSLLHVDAEDLTFKETEKGEMETNFDVVAIAFGDNGEPVDQISHSYTFTILKQRYEELLRDGFVYEFVFPMKKAGAYQLRVALRDQASGRVGSSHQFVNVPDLKRNRLTLSGIALENITIEEWSRRHQSEIVTASLKDPLMATSRRQFKPGTVLNFGFIIFNPNSRRNSPPNLTSRMRLYKDNQVVFTGSEQAVPLTAGQDSKAVQFVTSLSLGSEIEPGDYMIEIMITDGNREGKSAVTSEFVHFEVVAP